MDLSRVYTKTSKGILEGNTKSRDLTREHGRVLALIDGKSNIGELLEKNSRLSESRLAEILDELVEFGMIRQLNGALAVDDLGFSSTIIVGESNTQAFFEAQAHLERELRRADDRASQEKERDRATLLSEVKADIAAEAEALKREISERDVREVKAQGVARLRREEDVKAQADEKARQAQAVAEAQARAVAEHARKQIEIETRARAEAEARAKALEAEVFARAEAVRKAKEEVAQRAQAEAEAQARIEAEKKAREQAEKQALAAEKAREAAERKALKEAAENARRAKAEEAKARARREMEAKIQAKEEAKRRAETEARLREMEREKRRAEEESRALAKALDEARLATELEARVKRRIEARAREEKVIRQRAEEETRLRQEAEARAQEEAEARRLAEAAQIEAERKAREEAELRAREEAERKAREEAELRAREEAELRAREEAELRAREEAERKAREEAERKAREEAELKAREEAELKAREEAELRAREEAERKAREEAERKAREEAELRAREEAERKAREEAELRAREEAERKAREEAELRAREEAERKAREEAERKAREEAERKAREEAELRAREEAERKAREEAERKARALAEAEAETETQRMAEAERLRQEAEARDEQARLEREAAVRQQEIDRAAAEARERETARQRAREIAEAAARAEAEEAQRRVAEAARREEDEEARLRTEAEARARVAARSAAVFPFLTPRKRIRIRFDKKLFKSTVYSVFGLLLLALAALHLVSFNFYMPSLERELTNSLGQRVAMQNIRFSVYPAPHLKLEGVAIGDLADVRIGTARLFPVLTSWFTGQKLMRRVELEAVSLSEDSVDALPIWRLFQTQSAPMLFEHIKITDARLANRLLDLFAFNAEVKLDHGRFTQTRIKSTDQRITIDLTPQADGFAIQLAADRSVLPLEPRIQFDELKVTGVALPGRLTLSKIEGQLYGGSFNGSAQVEWRNGWLFTSDLGLRHVAIEPALSLFTRNMKVSGALEAKVRLTTKSNTLETLMDAPQVQATFRVREGELSGVDLVRAIQSGRNGGNIGGKTHFNELSGYLQLANGRYQYRQLKLLAGMMNANGNVEFTAERNLSGNLVGELRTRATALRTPFTLGGTLDTPTLKVALPAQRPAPVKAPVPEEE